MSSITLKGVTKVYEKEPVVENLNLAIKDGSFTVLVGPSGCGKSTILRMIAGLEKVTGGDIFLGDRRINDIAPGKRNIAMVFQNYALYPSMTVRRNIEFGLENKKIPKTEIEKRTAQVAETVGLTSYLDRLPANLSGGQRQRVALARAMVKNPSVFLMDEPLSNLDAKLRTQMRVELINMHKKMRTTFVYVTHDQTEAMSMADDIVLLRNGKIIQQSSPWELYHNPNCIYSAQFIGNPQSNIVEHVMPNNLVLGFRPEKVQLKEVEDSISVSAQVQTKEMLGSEVIYSMKTKYGIVQCKSNLDLPEDQIRKIYVSYSDLMLFDAEGNRTSFGKEEKQMVQKAFAGTEE